MYIMLSIHPQYAEKILDGTKLWEYRKTLPTTHLLDVTGVVVYATAPVSRIVGEFETDLTKTRTASPCKLWHETDGERDGGITKEAFDKYFEGHDYGYAIPVLLYSGGSSAVRYDVPRRLADFGLKKPPQGFAYLKKYNGLKTIGAE